MMCTVSILGLTGSRVSVWPWVVSLPTLASTSRPVLLSFRWAASVMPGRRAHSADGFKGPFTLWELFLT